MGSAWLSGINLYATVFTLGLLQRFHLVQLPGDLSRISDTWVLAIAGAMYLIQFIADKIPAIDSTWDHSHLHSHPRRRHPGRLRLRSLRPRYPHRGPPHRWRSCPRLAWHESHRPPRSQHQSGAVFEYCSQPLGRRPDLRIHSVDGLPPRHHPRGRHRLRHPVGLVRAEDRPHPRAPVPPSAQRQIRNRINWPDGHPRIHRIPGRERGSPRRL